MRRFLLVPMMLAMLVAPCWAASSAAQYQMGDVAVIDVVMEAAADGSFAAYQSPNINGLLVAVETDPAPYVSGAYSGGAWTETAGSSATYSPTDNYDITLLDASGADVMGGELANRDQSSTEIARPLVDSSYSWVAVWGPLDVTITNNSAANAVVLVRLYVYRP